MAQNVPQVRGHHLLCVMTYVGAGYTQKFVQAMDRLVLHLGAGQQVVLRTGPDVLCQVLVSEGSACAAHCSAPRNIRRDVLAMQQLAAVTGSACSAGTRVDKHCLQVPKIRAALQREDAAQSMGGLRRACVGCEWLQMCRRVSQSNFIGARLQVGPVVSAAAGNGKADASF